MVTLPLTLIKRPKLGVLNVQRCKCSSVYNHEEFSLDMLDYASEEDIDKLHEKEELQRHSKVSEHSHTESKLKFGGSKDNIFSTNLWRMEFEILFTIKKDELGYRVLPKKV